MAKTDMWPVIIKSDLVIIKSDLVIINPFTTRIFFVSDVQSQDNRSRRQIKQLFLLHLLLLTQDNLDKGQSIFEHMVVNG